MHIHVGIQNLQSRVRFHEGLEVVEMSHMMYGRYREATLKKLVQEAPKRMRFVVAVPQAITDPEWKEPFYGIEPQKLRGFTPGDEQNHVVNQICRAAGLLRAQTVFIRTPPSFTPGSNLENLRTFVQLPTWKNMRRVWQAEGVWDTAHAVRVARDMGIIPAWDPLLASVKDSGDFAYFRVRGPMPSKPLTETQFLQLLVACSSFKRSFVVFCTLRARMDAFHFLHFLKNEL